MKTLFSIVTPIFSLLTFLAAWLSIRPLRLKKPSPNPEPAQDYRQAIDRVEQWQADEADQLNSVCQARLMTHGQQTDRVIVFWHGFTSCPRQFEALGQRFFEMGYNVLIPRLPYHGYNDRMTTAPARLTAEQMTAWAGDALDTARGLGRHVTVVGFSLGGVLTGWAAQFRPDVDRAVIISPAFWLNDFPDRFRLPIINFLLVYPNVFRWWDEARKSNGNGPPHAYPRFSTRALGQMLKLGWVVQTAARRQPPAGADILVITNPTDWAVDNDVTAQIVNGWQHNNNPDGRLNLQTYAFDAAHQLRHDFIDPMQPNQPIELTYPILVDLIANGGRPA